MLPRERSSRWLALVTRPTTLDTDTGARADVAHMTRRATETRALRGVHTRPAWRVDLLCSAQPSRHPGERGQAGSALSTATRSPSCVSHTARLMQRRPSRERSAQQPSTSRTDCRCARCSTGCQAARTDGGHGTAHPLDSPRSVSVSLSLGRCPPSLSISPALHRSRAALLVCQSCACSSPEAAAGWAVTW